MKRVMLVVCIVLLIGAVETLGTVGVGVKLLNGNVPFIVGEIGTNALSAELGIGLESLTIPGLVDWTMLWYSAVGRLAFPVAAFMPYVGVGGIGLSIIVSSDLLEESESASVFGLTGEGGIRYSFLETFGFPLRIYGGVSINWYPSSGTFDSLGIGGIAMGWHIGAVVPF